MEQPLSTSLRISEETKFSDFWNQFSTICFSWLSRSWCCILHLKLRHGCGIKKEVHVVLMWTFWVYFLLKWVYFSNRSTISAFLFIGSCLLILKNVKIRRFFCFDATCKLQDFIIMYSTQWYKSENARNVFVLGNFKGCNNKEHRINGYVMRKKNSIVFIPSSV